MRCDPEELFAEAKELRAPVELVQVGRRERHGCRSSRSRPAGSRLRPTRRSACSSARTASSSAPGSSSRTTRRPREGDRRGDDALPRCRGARPRLAGPGRRDERPLRRRARARRAARNPRLVIREPLRLRSRLVLMRIGVLAVQGNFREHAAMLRRLGAEPVEVRKPEQLAGLDGLVIPGGESTTFMRLMRLYGLEEAVRELRAADPRHVRRDDRARPATHLGLARHRRAPERLRAPGCELRGGSRRSPARHAACGASSSAPRASRAPARASRCSRSSTASPCCSGRAASWSLPSTRAHGRHARPRALPRIGQGGEPMSGHSKWASIKRKKGATDAKRGQLFSKLVAGDHRRGARRRAGPAANLALQNAIEKAREASMPKDNIERAIARGSGDRRRRGRLRDRHVRGLRPRRRRALRRGADRQQQPHRGRRPPGVHEERRQPRRVRAPSRGSSSARA